MLSRVFGYLAPQPPEKKDESLHVSLKSISPPSPKQSDTEFTDQKNNNHENNVVSDVLKLRVTPPTYRAGKCGN